MGFRGVSRDTPSAPGRDFVLHERPTASVDYDHIWWWRKRLPEFKGRPCRVVARGSLNSALVEFPNGARVVTSRYAVRKRD
jgi:hypothetical protein